MRIPLKLPTGKKQDLPELENGVPIFTEDTLEMFIGSEQGNIPFSSPRAYKMDDAIYSWWINPLAIHYEDEYDKTYYSWVDKSGKVWIASFNHETKVINKYQLGEVSNDDHNAPAIVPPRKGTDEGFTVFYTGHNDNNEIYYRVSQGHEDITEWGSEQTITISQGVVTYVQAYRIDAPDKTDNDGDPVDTHIHLFTRTNGLNGEWVYLRSKDNGATWSEQLFFDDGTNATYLLTNARGRHDEDSLIRFVTCDHPIQGEDQGIYMGILYLDDGRIMAPRAGENGDTIEIANLQDGTGLPLSSADLVQIYESSYDPGDPTSERTRLFNVGSSDLLEVVFCSFNEDSEGNLDQAEYKYLVWDGVSYIHDMIDPGKPIEEPNGENWYFGGMWLEHGAKRGIVYVSREEDGNWFMEKWKTEDEGYNWDVELVDHVQNDPDADVEDEIKLFRPMGVMNRHPELEFIYNKGMYEHFSSPSNWDTNIILSTTKEPTRIAGEIGTGRLSYGKSLLYDDNLWEEDPPDGYYLKYLDGRLICKIKAELTYQGSSYRLKYEWNFPIQFKEPPFIMATLNGTATTATPTPKEMTVIQPVNITISSCDIYQYRISGGTDFVDGDTLGATIEAWGFWK